MFMNVLLSAKEPTVVILDNVISNEVQEFRIGEYSFRCIPYGVLSLERLYSNSKLTSRCQKSIYDFYKKYPDLKYYAQRILKREQMYHVEFKNQECILYASGEKTFSELLLENGLAVINPMFRDEEFKYVFNKAQLNAKMNKYGMFKENIINNCIVELYK